MPVRKLTSGTPVISATVSIDDQEIPDAGLQEWEEENEVTPVARQVAEQVMHASEAEASVVHRLQNQLTK